ncbi:hypothetical protein B0O99DRAFT_637179 [Bisporella sp. PMI_857]|nr:hypothetical protein B0O99DRAFT_637179 [Bisporella sp. PMI_857]
MSAYEVKGKFAIITGAGSGICHALAEILLEAGCSVMIADLRLRPEAEATLNKYSSSGSGAASAAFHATDISNWSHISSLWETTLKTFPRVDIVINGAGLYEPPSSTFWNAPGISALAEDPVDAQVGQYKTFAVNTMGPIRLAQIAIDYWLENRDVEGNLLWIASLGGYIHSVQTPLYFASKAAIISVVKSFACLRKDFGIRNSAVCPGAVNTPIFHPGYCKDRVRPDDLTLTPQQCASVIARVLQEPQYGDGNIVETMLVGTKAEPSVNVREVPLEALYPKVGPVGQDNHLLEEEQKLVERIKKNGMRGLN